MSLSPGASQATCSYAAHQHTCHHLAMRHAYMHRQLCRSTGCCNASSCLAASPRDACICMSCRAHHPSLAPTQESPSAWYYHGCDDSCCRIGYSMISGAEAEGKITPGKVRGGYTAAAAAAARGAGGGQY